LPAGKFNQRLASKIEAGLKGVVSKQSNLFEGLGVRYFGPVDGHNVVKLTETIKDLLAIPGPKILHITTVKGKGYDLAEKDQTLWHAPGIFDKDTGIIEKKLPSAPQPPKYQDVFGKTIIELAKTNNKVMGITPAMPSGCSLKYMIAEMPERAFDVGICEQHAVTVSAGLATQGMKVFCNIYSSFMQRAYDQVIHDVAIQKLPVVFCLDRGGLVGDDGPTHHGCYDIAYMRCIPNMIVASPMNEQELRNMMYTAQLPTQDLPFSIRYPRGEGVMPEWQTPLEEMQIGKARLVEDGSDLCILSFGHVGNFATKASQKLKAQGISVCHYDMRFVKPIDADALHYVGQNFNKVITIEDGTIIGGFGSAVLEFFNEHNYKPQVNMLGIPDRLVEHGKPAELHRECGFDEQGIYESACEMMNKSVATESKIVLQSSGN
jgi:1-deoxy-D-xylulose-5-phosphate synthase